MMTYLYLAIIAFAVYKYIQIRRSRKADILYPYDCISVSAHYSIYSRATNRGRNFYIINNSAPQLISSAIYHNSSFDTTLSFLKRIEVTKSDKDGSS